MSRQSKNARNIAKRKQITAMHANGEKGASKTTPLHGKRWGYRNNPDTLKRAAEAAKGSSAPREKTAMNKILAGAGGASA